MTQKLIIKFVLDDEVKNELRSVLSKGSHAIFAKQFILDSQSCKKALAPDVLIVVGDEEMRKAISSHFGALRHTGPMRMLGAELHEDILRLFVNPSTTHSFSLDEVAEGDLHHKILAIYDGTEVPAAPMEETANPSPSRESSESSSVPPFFVETPVEEDLGSTYRARSRKRKKTS